MKTIDENYFKKADDGIKKDKFENILSSNEKILMRLKPKKKAYIAQEIFKYVPFALIWGCFDFGIIIFLINQLKDFSTGFIISIISFFVIHLLPVWLMIVNVIKATAGFKNIEYALTDKRIIARSGLIGIDFKSIYYSDIEGINVKVSITDRLFKVGDLYVTASNQSAVLHDLTDPYFLMSKIQKITYDIKADIEFPNDYRPKQNHGYNTEYIDKLDK